MDARTRLLREAQEAGHSSGLREGLGALWEDVQNAMVDIRQKVVEEGVYGRVVTPANTGIHGPAEGTQPYSYADYCRAQVQPAAPELDVTGHDIER